MRFVLFLGLLISNLYLCCQPSDLFDQANQSYTIGKYEEAIAQYEEVIDKGFYSFELYYNLGNAYYRNDAFAKSILFYEKAKRLNASDEDLLHNIELANKKIVDQKDEIVDEMFSGFVISEFLFAVLALVFLALAVIGLSLFIWGNMIFLRKLGMVLGLSFMVLFITSSCLAFMGKSNQDKASHGIITRQVCNVKTEPNANSKDAFVLHEGSKVELLSIEGVWCKVKYSSKKIGWIEKETFEEI